jgi:hypothetical protein
MPAVTGRRFGYVYGGTATFADQMRELEGTAWSLGRCDEVRLRSLAVRDLSRSEGVPLAGIEITRFWFSEIVTDADMSPDPFRPYDVPDTEPGTACSGDN